MLTGLFERLFTSQPESDTAGKALAEVVHQGLDLQTAIAAHEAWKIRLDTWMAGASEEDLRPEEICFDDRCDLGRWLHGGGRRSVGHLSGFKRLVEQHKTFHYAASNVVALARSGRKAEASRMLTGPYRSASREVLGALKEMKAFVAHSEDALRRARQR